MLDVSCALEEGDGDDVPTLVIQLGEGDLSPISRVSRACCSGQWSFSVIEGNYVRRFFGRWVVVLGREVCFDIYMEGSR